MDYQYFQPINQNTRGRSYSPLLSVSGGRRFHYSTDLISHEMASLLTFPVGGFGNDTMVRGTVATDSFAGYQNLRVTPGQLSATLVLQANVSEYQLS